NRVSAGNETHAARRHINRTAETRAFHRVLQMDGGPGRSILLRGMMSLVEERAKLRLYGKELRRMPDHRFENRDACREVRRNHGANASLGNCPADGWFIPLPAGGANDEIDPAPRENGCVPDDRIGTREIDGHVDTLPALGGCTVRPVD